MINRSLNWWVYIAGNIPDLPPVYLDFSTICNPTSFRWKFDKL